MAREKPRTGQGKANVAGGGGTMKLEYISAALSTGESKVRKWKSLDRWEDDLKGSVPHKLETKIASSDRENKNAIFEIYNLLGGE
ncbi:phage terminase small subunit-related protein [Paenibacillus sp. IHBB 10380]|uniref:phage terminase small subunit-related protein n=1 Tax=Paenibacillus sp. IHBB 10380 TaxID=1566358 RepID=UPI0005CFE59B|nr:phage terminase small subunit-related protein [Paenibacillus sp. IHBB 10380]AJS57785.1 hypothetical protein UB51_03945 [Paenibacillus sp. IHBB 10380]